jgi:hypothetical protein
VGLFASAVLFLNPLVQAADNQELWDIYPSAVIFSQFDDNNHVIAADTVSWSRYGPADAALSGQTFVLDLTDAVLQASLTADNTVAISFDAAHEWQWSDLFTRSFWISSCLFKFDQSVGIRLLANSEGYQVAQRERLAWSGADGVCPDRVSEYLQSTALDPVMPVHLGDWQDLGKPGVPTETGRFEMRLLHDIRRTRRLLPFDQTVEAGADPLRDRLGALENGKQRFDLIFNRLSSAIFRSSFELNH